MASRGGNHRLLGHAFEMMSDMREDCVREAHARRSTVIGESAPPRAIPYRSATAAQKRSWRVLALFDSDYLIKGGLNWVWGDAGELYFWIREQHLAARRFDLVQGIIDSA